MKSSGDVECVFEGLCHLGEGPLWNVREQKLFWTDIYSRRIWVHDPRDRASRIFWEGPHQVGGFAFTPYGGMVLCTDSGVYLLDAREAGKIDGLPRKLFEIPLEATEGFNDVTVDPVGRMFAGTLRRSSPGGTLYRLEKNREPVAVISEVSCSNGMTFSLNEKYFFHTDSGIRRITRYAYDRVTGEITRPAVFFQGTEAQGYPDGITLDSEGHIWVAFWGASIVCRLAPDGSIVQRVEVPARQPSSVMLGGKDLKDLYITTACEGAADLDTGVDADGNFLGGRVYRHRAQVAGRPEWLADFD